MKPRVVPVLVLLALSVTARLTPYLLSRLGMPLDPAGTAYPWNFSPILPLCIFGGACYAQPRLAYSIPFATLLLGDLGIWALTGRFDWAFYSFQPVVYLAFAFVATTGFALRGGRTWRGVAAAGLVASTGFFALTNFGVWAFGDGSIYPHTLTGLVDCYVRALPFFRNTLISMAVFLPLLFSRAALARPASAPAVPIAAPPLGSGTR